MTKFRWSDPPKETDPARVQPDAHYPVPVAREGHEGKLDHPSAEQLLVMNSRLAKLKAQERTASNRLARLLQPRTLGRARLTEHRRRKIEETARRQRRLLDEIAALQEAHSVEHRRVYPPSAEPAP